ncbi:MAG: ATP-binding protein, partial [Myxococcales bacterium]|nr:ATP-binding protein [Myxococcales bacterium]
DPAEAQRQGLTTEQLAERTAQRWRDGLVASGQGAERIARLRAAGPVQIYTPGGDAGLPLSLLRSFRAPPVEVLHDNEAWRDKVDGAVAGLLALVGIEADPLRSREHILLAQLLDRAWREGRDVEIGTLVQAVVKPPFAQVGAFDLETFFPASDRTQLALALNSLIASPSFAAWTRGEPLDIPSLLFTAGGQPRISIMSIAHLGDAERMFFVTLLLNEVVTWMRTQPGTSSLRAIVFMDEVMGYLPPVATPPSKKPILTLLKQARAFGVGMVLATQNPVDIDYKALSNAGTWFLGRLQTERDKARVIEGLEGASAAAGAAFDKAAMEATLAGLTSRVFVLNNVHDDRPVVFQSRFAMSYLAGPLSRTQIQTLMAPAKQSATPPAPAPLAPKPPPGSSTRPIVPGDLPELFAPDASLGPALLAVAKVHYTDARRDLDTWRELTILAPLDETTAGDFWEHAVIVDPARVAGLEAAPVDGARFAPLPAALDAKVAAKLDDRLLAWLARAAPLTLHACPELKLVSKPDQPEAVFRAEVAVKLREARDAAVDKLRAKYAPRLAAIETKQRTAADRVAREQAQANSATADSAISVGASVLGAIFGGRRATASRIGSAARSVSRTASQRGDVERARAAAERLDLDRAELDAELAADVAAIRAAPEPEVTTVQIAPKKSDTALTKLALAWLAV